MIHTLMMVLRHRQRPRRRGETPHTPEIVTEQRQVGTERHRHCRGGMSEYVQRAFSGEKIVGNI